ncbi:S49 family peptidase [Iodobacter arcticus]|uniref:S49 family peptidase n=1 Tax=Iodobacter arcticus TaxID=590593 RepID=A0ABW2R432_9NEIS
MQLIHLASRLYGVPLLIARSKLDVILSVLGSRIGQVQSLIPETTAQNLQNPRNMVALLSSERHIAIIPIYGTLVRRSMGLEAASGLLSYAEIAARLDAAMSDPQIQGILLDIDSSGGEAGGVFELAQQIRLASQVKPIWAHANDSAYSAAYALAAAASRLTLSATAGVGSIGVIALHVDQSLKDAQDGLKYTALYAGHHKNDFTPHAPLSPHAASALQAEVERIYSLFIHQMATMRALDSEVIRATEAGLYFGQDAVAAGLADAVLSFDQLLIDFENSLSATQKLSNPRALSVISPSNLAQQEHVMDGIEETLTPPTATPKMSPPTPPPTSNVPPLTPPAPATTVPSEAQAIAELCLIAGASTRTVEFLAAGMSEAQVRHILLDARAEQPEISSRISADAGTSSPVESSAIVNAVKKLIHRE